MAIQNPPSLACTRCGLCCQKSGPGLHKADLHLLMDGFLPRALLLTLRKGEQVFDNVSHRLTALEAEMVKLAAPDGASRCPFYESDPSACAIHARRPQECRALDCRDTRAICALYTQNRLGRADILNTGGGLWQVVTMHENTFPAAQTVSLARMAAAGDRVALSGVIELTARERDFRRAFADRFEHPPDQMNFLFGRSLARIAAAFGLSGL